MELREIKEVLKNKKQELKELWRSLWHRFYKEKGREIRIRNK